MLKQRLGGHRGVRIGTVLAGVSALAIGFASPAFAAQNVNNGNADNANAQNYVIVQGGSQASYQLMLDVSNIFNQAPGCDLVGEPGADQPLDYGCPGLNGEEGTAQPAAGTISFTGVTLTAGSKNVGGGTTNTATLAAGDECYDSLGGFAQSDEPISSIKSATKFKIKTDISTSETNDTITCVTTPQAGQSGFTVWGNENPFNDFLLQEPSYGASNGIQELEGTGSSTVVGHSASTDDPATFGPVNVSPLDAARSSRGPKLTSTGDYQGLNFVAYAEDAVTYLTWSKVGSATTDSAACLAQIGNNPTVTELKTIWNETYTSGVPNETWNSVFGCTSAGSSDPIYAYWASNGSGTESVWASATGATFQGLSSSTWPAKNTIFQDETDSILRNASTEPLKDVIYFYSYGDYNAVCTPTPATAAGEASTNPLCSGAGNTVELGTEAAGVTLSPSTINDQLPKLEGTAYFGDRLLYNVYSDGSNPQIPQSSPATENAISEDGFMCKPSTKEDIDPNTGLTYLSEIQAAIRANGFYPLPNLQVEDGQGDTGNTNPGYSTTASGIPHPAWNYAGDAGGLKASQYNAANETYFNPVNTDTDNSAVSGTYNGVEDGSATLSNGVVASPTAPVGYCITLSSDGSSAGQ